MLNQTVLVGRLVKDPELRETESGTKVTNVTLAVPRNYKNADGEYESDYVDCVLWKSVAENTTTYVKKGDLVGIKGHLRTRSQELEDGSRRYSLEVCAEKVTFLSSTRTNEKKDYEER